MRLNRSSLQRFARECLSPSRPNHATHVRGIQVLKSIKEMWDYRDSLPKGATVGFVPTMGALHAGHISLVKRSKQECNVTLSSIFVNPTQFSPGEDLDKYPRQLEADLKLLEQAQVDAVFVPTTADMYRPHTLCHVEPSQFSAIREGLARPEFFRGVATVVCKLFNITQPTHAYFGQKDISQCILLLHMVRDLNMRVNVIICETMREHDGLAMSSRNAYLTSHERSHASVLYKALSAGQAQYDKVS
ncbi:pantoate--beta-alanine ligase [archaeon]|nr:MAG: pantoate--beta-alanine ligase [archaeon]